MKQRLAFLIVGIGVALLAAIFLTSTSAYALSASGHPVAAPTIVPSSAVLKVYPGILAISSSEVYFPEYALTGLLVKTNQVGNIILISDGSGSGLGWHLTMRGSDFLGADHRKLYAEDFYLQIKPEDIVSVAGGKPPQPTTGDLYLSGIPRVIVIANPDTGMGTFQTKAALGLILPANTYAGLYKGEFVVVAISSP